jgi:histidyl-tRNA synthetase
MRELGLTNIELNINSVGCPECRPKYHEILKEFLSSKLDNLCETCQERYEKNPLRILDCKNPSCQAELVEAPVMLEHLCDDCEDHFAKLKTYLGAMGVEYVIDPKIVRGLDYYTKTAFEFISGEIGAQSTVCGGGRYNKLVAEIGGPETPGVGFGMGIERLIMTLEANGIEFPEPDTADLFIVAMGDDALAHAVGLTQQLRVKGIAADTDHMARSMKAQLKFADKMNAKHTVVLGSNEIEDGKAQIKNMETGEKTEVSLTDIESIISLIKPE